MSFNILVVGDTNAAHSIMLECILNHLGDGRVNVGTVGPSPRTETFPEVLKLLESRGFDLRDVLAAPRRDIPAASSHDLSLILILSGLTTPNASRNLLDRRDWPNGVVTAEWPMPDLEDHRQNEAELAHMLRRSYRALYDLATRLLAVPVETLSPDALRAHVLSLSPMADTA